MKSDAFPKNISFNSFEPVLLTYYLTHLIKMSRSELVSVCVGIWMKTECFAIKGNFTIELHRNRVSRPVLSLISNKVLGNFR